MEIKIGDKVRCVDDTFDIGEYWHSKLNLPKRGEIYTVREYAEGPSGHGFRLEEIINEKYRYLSPGTYIEPAFISTKFERV